MYELIYLCLEILTDFGQGYCLQFFFGRFLKKRKSTVRSYGIFVVVAYGLLRFMIGMFMQNLPESIKTVIKPGIYFLCAFLLSLLFYKGQERLNVFLAVTFLAVSEISFFLSYIIIQAGNHVFDFWIWLADRQVMQASFLERISFITACGLQGIFYAAFLCLLYFFLKKIAGEFKEKEPVIQRTEMVFLLAPGLMGILLSVLLRVIMVTVENNVPKLLYDKYPVLTVIIPVILIVSLLSIFYGVRLFQELIFLEREKSSRIILEKQINSLQQHMKEMERVSSGLNGMKHDMKNIISVIMGLAGNKKDSSEERWHVGDVERRVDDKELKNYLNELNRTFERFEYRFKTGNHVVDALLNMKYYEGTECVSGLEINADGLLFPNDLLIQSFDIGIILGNALDNAIEACRKQKEEYPDKAVSIRLFSYQRGQKGNLFFIEIENSFCGRLVQRNGYEFPESNKPEKEKHGLGLMNIKQIAEKYHGGVDWAADGRAFVLTVMLKNGQGKKGDGKHGF